MKSPVLNRKSEREAQASPAELEWQERVLKPSLERSPERHKVFTTTSGVAIERLYTPADLAAFDPERDLGSPGEFP
ncbi:MAG: methylmalonyl-CoA mutase, partial [Terriglobia bacterium]